MKQPKPRIEVKPSTPRQDTRWAHLLTAIVLTAIVNGDKFGDFLVSDNGSSLSLFLNGPRWSLKLNKDGTWSVE